MPTSASNLWQRKCTRVQQHGCVGGCGYQERARERRLVAQLNPDNLVAFRVGRRNTKNPNPNRLESSLNEDRQKRTFLTQQTPALIQLTSVSAANRSPHAPLSNTTTSESRWQTCLKCKSPTAFGSPRKQPGKLLVAGVRYQDAKHGQGAPK